MLVRSLYRRSCRLSALVAVSGLLAGCSKPTSSESEKGATAAPAGAGPASSAPASSASAHSAPGASAPASSAPAASGDGSASQPAAEPHCYDVSTPELPLQLTVEWTTKGEVGVVNVAADDHLNVRATASPTAALVGELAFDTRGIRATGQVCELGEANWYEIESSGKRGWVNGKFLGPTLAPIDATAEWAKRVDAKAKFATPHALVEALKKGFNDGILQEEARFQATLLSAAALGGIAVQGSEAVAELRTCCLADDSVAGDQTTLRLRHDAGSWKLSRATKRTLCYRGSDAAGKLCR